MENCDLFSRPVFILLLVFSGRSRDHFLHARACYMMKQNSPNCLLCPNESFPSKGFYLMHMHSKHNIEVDAMLCISCGISTSIFEYLPRHQIKCFQVIFKAIITCCCLLRKRISILFCILEFNFKTPKYKIVM